MNRKWLASIAAVAVLLLAVVGLSACSPEFSGGSLELKGSLNNQQEGIWVNGEGKVSAVPDVANLSLGVEAQADSVADAQSQASDAMDKVIKALKDNSVAEKDIQTSSFNIYKITRWDSNSNQEIVTGYRVSNTVTAKIRDVESAGKVIDAVAAAGGDLTRINSIGFTIDDPSSYQEEARKKAIANAAAKAKQLADATGVKLGKAVYITESSYTPSPIYRDSVAMKGEESVATTTTSISAGELQVTVNVQIAYEID